jgi:hypothetical protein
MDTFRCSHCGFETEDKGRFIRTNSDGDHVWLEMCCPQCFSANPAVGLVGESPFKNPVWGLETTNEGLYVWASTKGGGWTAAPMIRDHQLANAPASLIIESEPGTMMDLHRRLREQGEARSKAFHVEYEEIAARTEQPVLSEEADKARKRNLVGPYNPRKTFDGPTVMRGAPKKWTRVA